MGLVSPRSQAAAAHAEMQAQAELVSRQGSFQAGAVPLTPHAELPVGLSPLPQNGKTGTSVLYRKLQALIGCLSNVYACSCHVLRIYPAARQKIIQVHTFARCLQRADSILCTCHCCVLHNIDQDQINYFFLQ